MLDNHQLLFKNIFLFLFSLLAIFLILFLIKLLKKNKDTDYIFLKFNLSKILFLFSFIYLIIFIMYNHRVRECDELADAVKCQCYALKLLDEKDNLLKSNIAKEAQQNCSESIFFKKWLE